MRSEPPPLVGRDDELARVLAELGSGRSVVIAGAAGVGKTAVADAVATRVRAVGSDVMWATATVASQPIPFGALAFLVPTEGLPVHPAAMVRRLLDGLSERARSRDVLLVVDDAHLLDGVSAAALLRVASEIPVVCTMRHDVTAPDAVTGLWKDGWAARVDLAELDVVRTETFVAARLGGPVASATSAVLWQWSRGNPLFLSELVRDGQENGRLVWVGGLWRWSGGIAVPPRLGELFERRFGVLGPPQLDTLGCIALGEPLPAEAVDVLAPPEVVSELEEVDLLRSYSDGFDVWVRVSHPLLAAAVVERLSPARRRRLAGRLLGAAAESPGTIDVVRRAVWQLDSDQPVDTTVLCEASRRVQLTDPRLAARLARRALDVDHSVQSALTFAEACIELGDLDGARAGLAAAQAGAADEADVVAVGTARASFRAWSERDPRDAAEALATLRRQATSREQKRDVASLEALVRLFSAQTGDAVRLAEQVLADDPTAGLAAARAGLTMACGLTLVGRTGDAAGVAALLASELVDAEELPAYAGGMVEATVGFAELWRGLDPPVVASRPEATRWPMPAAGGTITWPLLDGVRRHLHGDLAAAIERLREATVHEAGGEGVFRSEAAAWFAVALADGGRPDEAAAVVADHGPDDVAMIPGLGPWAAAAILAARGHHDPAAATVVGAADEARGAGARLVEARYLVDAGRYGMAATIAARLQNVLAGIDAPLIHILGRGTLARATCDLLALLDAAEEHAAHGLRLHAEELATVAVERSTDLRLAERGRSLLRQIQTRSARTATAAPPSALTARELEIAEMAAQGMSDREIATELVVSIRTVESHLGRAYRKLGISSRHHLPSGGRDTSV